MKHKVSSEPSLSASVIDVKLKFFCFLLINYQLLSLSHKLHSSRLFFFLSLFLSFPTSRLALLHVAVIPKSPCCKAWKRCIDRAFSNGFLMGLSTATLQRRQWARPGSDMPSQMPCQLQHSALSLTLSFVITFLIRMGAMCVKMRLQT